MKFPTKITILTLKLYFPDEVFEDLFMRILIYNRQG